MLMDSTFDCEGHIKYMDRICQWTTKELNEVLYQEQRRGFILEICLGWMKIIPWGYLGYHFIYNLGSGGILGALQSISWEYLGGANILTYSEFKQGKRHKRTKVNTKALKNPYWAGTWWAALSLRWRVLKMWRRYSVS
jgi:hypothetical protein